jgi:hypothetical protein
MSRRTTPRRPSAPAEAAAPPQSERWSVQVGADDTATLDIPPDARRERSFEVSCRFVVRMHEGAVEPWHGLQVYANGALEWSRRIATSNPGASDSIDVQFRQRVPAGRPLRVVARSELHGAERLQLAIEAEES